LAEDFAAADWMTNGRVTFGVGRGYHTREVESFGSPLMDQPANRELFEEQVQVIFKAFNERSFSHHSKYFDFPPQVPYRGYQLEEITLVPRPKNLPVECWQPIQGGTGRALEFMASMGIKGVIGGGSSEGGAMDGIMHAYRDALTRHGKPEAELGEDLAVGFHFHIAPTVEEAARQAGRYYEENLKMFGPLRLTRGLTEQQILDISNPQVAPNAGLPRIEDAIENGSVLAGTPESIIEKLKGVEERYPGLKRVQVGQPVGTPQPLILEQLQWFAEEVMPAFKNVEVAVPADD
jgi:alkanesulfonate monooxygenase SsuD/methylene tetrahydromethanopterin reductase-like flavin-dependent oxidoreductase (luciferase family)